MRLASASQPKRATIRVRRPSMLLPSHLSFIIFTTYSDDPCVRVFSRMDRIDKAARGLNINFLYTHPTFDTRIEVRKPPSVCWAKMALTRLLSPLLLLGTIQRLNKLLPVAYALRDNNPDCVRTLEHVAGFRDAMGLVRGPQGGVWGWA